MKKIILLFCLMGFYQVQSQPLMSQLYNFQWGHVYSYQKVPQGWNIDTSLIPTVGSNLVWGFDTISLLPNVYTDSILNPAGTIGANAFSNADFVWKEYSGTLQYYRKNQDTVFYMGHYIWFPTTFTPNPMTCIFNTPQSTNYLYDNFQTNVAGNGTWTYSARYNASGTLKLPGVTHNDVGLYVTVGGHTTKYADYLWFKENQKDPVLRIQFVWISTSSTVQYLYVNTTALTPSGYSQVMAPAFSIAPNPATDVIHLDAPYPIKNYEVRNVFGQLLLHRELKENHTTIDISSLPKGIYVLKVQNENLAWRSEQFVK